MAKLKDLYVPDSMLIAFYIFYYLSIENDLNSNQQFKPLFLASIFMLTLGQILLLYGVFT